MSDGQRYTVSQETLQAVIDQVIRDTDEFIHEKGEAGARARCVREVYPALMRWLVTEMDMNTPLRDAAAGASDTMGICSATVLYNTVTPKKYKKAGEMFVDRIWTIAEKLLTDTEFDSINLTPAGQS